MKLDNHLETKLESAENHELAAVEGGSVFLAGIAVGAWLAVGVAETGRHYNSQVNITDYCADRL